MATPEQEIREITDRYYNSFSRLLSGEGGLEKEFWSQSPETILMTAAGDRIKGWNEIERQLLEIAQAPFTGTMSARDLTVCLIGDVAFTTCIEHGDFSAGGERASGDHRATHIWRKEAGGWKLVLRHADIDPDLAALVNRLQRAA